MTTVAHRDLPEAIAAVIASVPRTGLERWHTVLQFEPDRGPVIHLVVAEGRINLRRGGHPSPTTAVRTTREALAEVFLTERDITHHFADGGMRLRCGDYYDVIFLSRALGRLRRDQLSEVTE
jgi:hypothetical protein